MRYCAIHAIDWPIGMKCIRDTARFTQLISLLACFFDRIEGGTSDATIDQRVVDEVQAAEPHGDFSSSKNIGDWGLEKVDSIGRIFLLDGTVTSNAFLLVSLGLSLEKEVLG
ncbi:hypothetical protein CRG98_024298 [Punica granatum]|uniref:Uncharacterized protein n=1 Tax=Punica granatum TaxID=22663 RepID=A0A2I0JGB2_PUNGR|nr:hypothetical protein CRG98_024298 [Punica granatum]